MADGLPSYVKVERPLRERDIEQYLVDRVKAMGGEVRKVSWIGRRGAPDRLVMLPERPWGDLSNRPMMSIAIYTGSVAPQQEPATIWVELKAPGVKPEAHQLREHARMQAMGQRVVVIDSLAGVEELLS